MVALQPDHPDRGSPVDQLLEYAYENKYNDLFTVSSDTVRAGFVCILRMQHLISGYVSRRVGCYKYDATNIHSLGDLQNASNRMLASSYPSLKPWKNYLRSFIYARMADHTFPWHIQLSP